MAVTVIIPAFNEEIYIGSVVIKTKKYAEHVIVVDDGSTDSTGEIAKNAGAEVITHIKHKGKGQSLKTGFNAAMKNGAHVIVTIDADGQDNPDEIPKLLKPILSDNADMVIGSRFLKNGKKPFYYINRNGHIKDAGGFRAFTIKTFSIFKFGDNGSNIEADMLDSAIAAKLKITEVEIGKGNIDGHEQKSFYHGVKILINLLHDMEFRKPLYYFTIPGIIFGTIGLGMGLRFLEDFYNGGKLFFGPTLLMLLLTVVGLGMTFTGIVLHAIAGLIQKRRW